MKKLFGVLFLSFCALTFGQEAKQKPIKIDKQWQNLLDDKLSHWEIFVGVPHTSVQLEGHPKSENVHEGVPLGLNNDPKKVISTIKVDNNLLLKVSGEIYAGLTSLQEFDNYHLKLQFKWGEKKWEPRLNRKRDSGVLYHCHGKHGAFWNVWMSSLECQIQEGDMGDFVALVNVRADIASAKIKDQYYKFTGQSDQILTYGRGNPSYCHINTSNESPHGKWNAIEVICVNDKSIHVVNGKVVMVVHNTRKIVDGKEMPLKKGKIQLQSEGAEAYYKNIQIRAVDEFPEAYKKQAGL